MDISGIRQLMLEEGTRLHCYDDATGEPVVPGYTMVGHPTIGIGRSLDTHGVTLAEAQFLLDDDLAAIDQALWIFPWWAGLGSVRQFVIVDLAFNVGIRGMLGFKHMIAALGDSNFSLAATEMLASNWATELPTRAHKLASIMRTGQIQTA